MKILICFKNPRADNPSACHAGLGVTAFNQAEMLCEHGYDARAVPVVDGYYIEAHLRSDPAWRGVTHLVMCAPFFDTPFLAKLCGEFPHVRFAVVFHSNVGFLGVDTWSMGVLGEQLALQQRIHNFRVAGNSAKFCRAVLGAFGVACTLLPNLYFLHGPVERARALWSNGPIRIGAFGATRVLKNLPTAAWAAAIISRSLGADVEFHVSQGRAEGSGCGSVITTIRRLFAHHRRVTLIESGWESWLEFRHNTVRRMHLLMQPSFTESFNGVTADGIAEGVPSVVGPAIDWVPANWICNPDDAHAIARTGISLLRDRNAALDGYKALVRHNTEGLAAWAEFLA